jgi:hypothetical protein
VAPEQSPLLRGWRESVLGNKVLELTQRLTHVPS